MTKHPQFQLHHIKPTINHKTKILPIPHLSNLLPTINHLKTIPKIPHQHPPLITLHRPQSPPHIPLHIQHIHPHFYTFTGHKILPP
ncbi:aminotransferase class V-fold PLP-dependent enzyme, partial [Staphylococcus epidermidis]|uniref:aminotransferase class V-fold PLP-dependent enzyme n=1 Tax=Staphylococcus epidermidis TaxID=1282 RepID=UPI0037DA6026